MPESPRWLLAQGRYTEFRELVKTIAKQNGKEGDLQWVDETKLVRFFQSLKL